MDREHERILRRSHMHLRKSLTIDDDVLGHLYSGRIITDSEKSDVKAVRNSREQADVLLRLLPSRGRTAFAVFHDALRDSGLRGNKDLADMLRASEAGALSSQARRCYPSPVAQHSPSGRPVGVPESGDQPVGVPESGDQSGAVRPVQAESDQRQRQRQAAAGLDHDPWQHERFPKLMVWLVQNMDSDEARLYSFGEGLLTDAEMDILQGKTNRLKHNLYLLERMRPGGRDSFVKFLNVVDSMGVKFLDKRLELQELL